MNCLFFLTNVMFLSSVSPGLSDFDPETALCEDLVIDAAVTADDDISYVIKGDYYWTMTWNGIPSDVIARPLSDRWQGLKGPIDAAFRIEEGYLGDSTVFLKGKQWLLYNENQLRANGSTSNWTDMYDSPTLSAFEHPMRNTKTPIEFRRDYPVYLIHDSDWFSKYYFYEIQKPDLMYIQKAYRFGRWFTFTEDLNKEYETTIKDFMNPLTAVINIFNETIAFAPKNMCRMDIEVMLCKNAETPEEVAKYFGCPRKPLIISTTTPSTPITTTSVTTSAKSSTISRRTIGSVTTLSTPIESTLGRKTNKMKHKTTFRGIPEVTKRKAKTTPRVAAGVEGRATEKPEEDSPWPMIAVILGIVAIIGLFLLFSFTVVFRNPNMN